jgi:hypothetical protein
MTEIRVECGQCGHPDFYLMQRKNGTRYLRCQACGNEAQAVPNFVRGSVKNTGDWKCPKCDTVYKNLPTTVDSKGEVHAFCYTCGNENLEKIT